MIAQSPLRFARSFAEFRAPSWAAWRRVLSKLSPAVRELYVVAGRGAGKSRAASLLAAFYATRRYKVAAGEEIYVAAFAPDRRQAALTFKYTLGLLRSRPELAALVEKEGSERVELAGGVVLEVLTASTAAPRGRSYAAAIVEEAAFLPVDDAAADPDVELVRALRPGLARVPNSLLVILGSPFARRGVLYEAATAGTDLAAGRLVVQGDTASFNPAFDVREIERAFRADPVAAASEYGRDGAIEFRADVSAVLAEAALLAATPRGVRELEPDADRVAFAHFDAATGAGSDAAALAIAYTPIAAGDAAELALVRRWRPPFSPAAVVAEASALVHEYAARRVSIDRFAPGLVIELFREHGVAAAIATHDTSAAFVALLALVNSSRVRLLDDDRLLAELRRLERRPGSGGRERVGHPERQGAHDDLAAAAAQALCSAAARQRERRLVWGRDVVGSKEEILSRRQRRDDADKTLEQHAAEKALWVQVMRDRIDRDRPGDDRLSVPVRFDYPRAPEPSPPAPAPEPSYSFGNDFYDPLQGQGGKDRW